jgi:ribosome-binding ATPase YchF (GTP1/OBG family)
MLGAGIVLEITKVLIEAFEKAWKKEEKIAEVSKTHAEELTNEYKESKKAFEDLQKTIDSYKDKKDSLDGLVKGTLEYKQALIEANDEAYKLIELYGSLANYSIDENGVV